MVVGEAAQRRWRRAVDRDLRGDAGVRSDALEIACSLRCSAGCRPACAGARAMTARRSRPGIAHIGVGAFHRAHQAEVRRRSPATRFDRWGIVGINIREPLLAGTLGRQSGLYTRLLREDDRVEPRVIGSILRVVDSQEGAAPALAVLAAPEIDVITMTVTEKGYCHRPATGTLDFERPEIAHDLAYPEAPISLPGSDPARASRCAWRRMAGR